MSTSYQYFVKNQTQLQRLSAGKKSLLPPPTLLRFPVDTDINNLIINDARISDQLASAVQTGEILETMDYAAGTLSLTILDRSRTLIKGLLKDWVSANTPRVYTSIAGQRRKKVVPAEWNEIYCTFDGRDYALVQVNKSHDQFDLTFENRTIHEMRRYSKPRIWYRDQHTRAQVILAMCQEVRNYNVQFYAPELDVIQPIAVTHAQPTPKEVASKKMKGFHKGTKFDIKGKSASKQQINHVAEVIRVGDSMKVPYNVHISALISIIEISNAKDVQGSTEFGGGNGLFGFINSTSMSADAHSFYQHAMEFYKIDPTTTPGQMAFYVLSGTRVVSPFKPAEFDRWVSEAQEILTKWGTSLTGGSVTFTEYNRYAFKRGLDGKREDSWNCAVRLAKEVNWRVFSTDNILWWVDDNDLRYSIPWDTIDEDSVGIDSIDYEIDTGKALNEVTISAYLSRWQCPPGVPVVIENSGPADGRWLVYEVRRPLDTDLGEITCHLPAPALDEPAPTTKRVSISGSKLGGIPIAVTKNAVVDTAYAKAIQISNKHYPYVYAGGHNSNFAPSLGPPPGYDCSGYVSAILSAAGTLQQPEASGGLESWGQAGPGKLMTIWTNAGHVFIEFNLPQPIGHVQANTSHGSFDGNKWGAMVLPWGYNGKADADSGSFMARHWPGT
jgi:hypothetical protein